MQSLRLALSQINPTVGDLDGNVRTIADGIEAARDAGADLVVFPELALCGYPPEDLLLKPQFLADCRRALDDVARHTSGIAALVGFPDVTRGHVFNAAAVLGDTRLLATYHKIELPNYGVFDEKRYFTQGARCVVFEVNGISVSVTVCEDIWLDYGAAEHHATTNRAAIVANLSASPYHAGKLALRRQVLARFARRTRAFVAYTNLVGGQDELVFDGGSLVLDPEGEPLAVAQRFEEALLVADIQLPERQAQAPPRQVNGRWGKRIALTSSNSQRREPSPAPPATALSHLEEVHQALLLGTRDYVRKNGFQKTVVGLSGGIDSALTAAIAVEALGAGNVVAVTMPSHHTSSDTRTDAARLAANLGVPLLTIPIKAVLDTYLDALAPHLGPGEPGVETENLQARIRGNLLMALSNRFGWLVLTTGNKSETAVGYCTLYGDTAGGFAVINDVPKTLVYQLAEQINLAAGRDLIPASILTRPPTAELRPDQLDTDSLPPYDTLDPILRAYVEEDKAPDDIAGNGFDPDTVRRVVRLVDRSEYKRRQSPPGVKITPKAFGRDRRLPITNRYAQPVDGPPSATGSGPLAPPPGDGADAPMADERREAQ